VSSALLNRARRKLSRLFGRARGLRLQFLIHRSLSIILAQARRPRLNRTSLDRAG